MLLASPQPIGFGRTPVDRSPADTAEVHMYACLHAVDQCLSRPLTKLPQLHRGLTLN